MHIFDIRRSPDVLRTWRDIHSRSEMISTSSNAMRASLGSNDTEHVSNTGVTSPDSPFGPIDVQSNNLTDARRRWVQHCDPPQVQTSAPAFQVESDSKKVRTATVDAVREHNVVEVESEFKIGCITEEGRRQVGVSSLNRTLYFGANRFDRQKRLAPNYVTPATCLLIIGLRPLVSRLRRFGTLILTAKRLLTLNLIGFPFESRRSMNLP